jgi:hypothetical protein
MRIAGHWETGDEGIARPLLQASVHSADGTLFTDDFLIDTGADRTVFSAALFARLKLPYRNASPQSALSGVGGQVGSVLLTTVLELTHEGGGPVRVRGEFAAFTDPAATDLNILGRDVLDNFDLIVSRRRDEIHLLGGNHQYLIKGN